MLGDRPGSRRQIRKLAVGNSATRNHSWWNRDTIWSGPGSPNNPKNIDAPRIEPICRPVCKIAMPTPKFAALSVSAAVAFIIAIAMPHAPIPTSTSAGKNTIQYSDDESPDANARMYIPHAVIAMPVRMTRCGCTFAQSAQRRPT